METSKINTVSAKTIASSLVTGQVIRNGGNRLFEITSVTSTSVQLTPLNGERSQILNMGIGVFSKLFFMGNFVQVLTSNPMVEMIESRKTGADRFLVK